MLRSLAYVFSRIYLAGVTYEIGGLSMMLAALLVHAVGHLARPALAKH